MTSEHAPPVACCLKIVQDIVSCQFVDGKTTFAPLLRKKEVSGNFFVELLDLYCWTVAGMNSYFVGVAFQEVHRYIQSAARSVAHCQ